MTAPKTVCKKQRASLLFSTAYLALPKVEVSRMDTDEWWQRLDEEWGSSVSKADEECASVGCMVCAAVEEENFLPCRGR